MIVQKKNDVEIFGAVQFKCDEAEKTLAKYPMVDKVRYSTWKKMHVGPHPPFLIAPSWVYAVDGWYVREGNWLVTDKEGHTKVYLSDEFEKKFKRYGDKQSGLVQKSPEQYEAIRFKGNFFKRYGLAKYPMVTVRKYSAYPNKDNVIKKLDTTVVTADHSVVVVGNTTVRYLYKEDGKAVVSTENGDVLVKVPWKGTKTVWDKKHFLLIPYERKITKPIYDFDAPELYKVKESYWVNQQRLHFDDWIVTDKEGKSKVYSPDEFEAKFDEASEDEQEETEG